MVRINRARLEAAFHEQARIGATAGGGLTRLALSDEDKVIRDRMVDWLEGAGCTVRVDRMGNMFGRRAGAPDRGALPPVVMGSHVDSVPTGGRFDGVLGVLCALEAIRALDDAATRTRHPIELAIFTNEEGARFQPAMLGSAVMAGKVSLEDAYNKRDRHGLRLVDELERIGYLGAEPCIPRPMRAYLELHIEQGPFLEEAGLSVGVVEGIVGIAWSRITFHGSQDHAGPTPMRTRRDALVAGAELVKAVRLIPLQIGHEMVGTVGWLDVHPNIVNAIPGKVVMTADLRAADDADLDRALADLEVAVRDAAAAEGVRLEYEPLMRVPRTRFAPEVVDAVEEAAKALGVGYRRMLSGAGHDAQHMATLCPTGMVFVPSIGGKSHCEDEATHFDDIEQGANVLLRAALALAGPA
ncbi:MAG TPA: Zn-dependent hydrolase [Methylomirabilota bacterium]|jgi:N-carbamoyl-L-amino-acid hydrolase|nr:Zn-dependent hydrolase [Methylomirabilota bacterium]